MQSDLVKRFVSGSNTVVATATWTDISINVPVDVTSGLGIQIWAWDVEANLGYMIADGKSFKAILSRDAITAETYLSSPNVVDKIHLESQLATNGFWLFDNIIRKDQYPAVPYFSNFIHVGVYQDSGGNLAVYTRIWYSAIVLSRNELMGMLVNAGVP